MEFLVASLLTKSALGTLLAALTIARVILAVPSSGMVSCVGLYRGAMDVPMLATLVFTQRFPPTATGSTLILVFRPRSEKKKSIKNFYSTVRQ
jgi:hypothetical protein